VAQGLVSAGVSVVSANSAPFLAWVYELTNRTILTLEESAQQAFTPEMLREIEGLAADVIQLNVNRSLPVEW
jgi:Na+-translocating ferredoxin:NAD+ oxidoreductase RnfG subunit